MRYEHKLGLRFFAFMIDFIGMMILGIIMSFFGFGTVDTTGGYFVNFNYIEMMIVSVIYFGAFAFFNEGKTLGKIALKLEVKSGNTENIDRKALLLREGIKVLLLPISLISLIFSAVRDDHKTIHDMIADSIVLRRHEPIQQYYEPNKFKKPVQKQENQFTDNGFNEPGDYYDDPADKKEEQKLKEEDPYYY